MGRADANPNESADLPRPQPQTVAVSASCKSSSGAIRPTLQLAPFARSGRPTIPPPVGGSRGASGDSVYASAVRRKIPRKYNNLGDTDQVVAHAGHCTLIAGTTKVVLSIDKIWPGRCANTPGPGRDLHRGS